MAERPSTPGLSSSNRLTLAQLQAALTGIHLGGLRFFPSIGSTNDEALAWASQGATDFSLVLAEEQSAGRGRGSRKWHTPAGAALAFSLVLRAKDIPQSQHLARFSALGALALADVLQAQGIPAQIKWPNDLLIHGRKAAGALAETVWVGNEVESIVLGMGINVTPEAVPSPENLHFPATCIQSEGFSLPRLELLRRLLQAIQTRRSALTSPSFLQDWQNNLAYLGQPVRIWADNAPEKSGVLRGLNPDASLRLETATGEASIHFGEVHLRLV